MKKLDEIMVIYLVSYLIHNIKYVWLVVSASDDSCGGGGDIGLVCDVSNAQIMYTQI